MNFIAPFCVPILQSDIAFSLVYLFFFLIFVECKYFCVWRNDFVKALSFIWIGLNLGKTEYNRCGDRYVNAFPFSFFQFTCFAPFFKIFFFHGASSDFKCCITSLFLAAELKLEVARWSRSAKNDAINNKPLRKKKKGNKEMALSLPPINSDASKRESGLFER